uniref:Uncharacterized protein n=1 Tax=Rhizophagus irregularis (strain DAOM 181602 / DAOM 197198 / MUCL 43194) TaxID=747089 RepID=U9TAX3_RHIID
MSTILKIKLFFQNFFLGRCNSFNRSYVQYNLTSICTLTVFNHHLYGDNSSFI